MGPTQKIVKLSTKSIRNDVSRSLQVKSLLICFYLVKNWSFSQCIISVLQCQYAFIYQSLSDYLRLRSCCCWKRRRQNEEDYLIIGPPIDSTTCWSDVILKRSVHPENLELPSVHHVNRPKILTSRGLPSCPQRLETPLPFVVPAQESRQLSRQTKREEDNRSTI